MTNGIQSSNAGMTLANTTVKNEERAKAQSGNTQNKAELTKTQILKEQIAAGEYTIDIDTVARKMAEELLS